MAWAILGFATAPLIVQWDWSALSESPSLSVLALLCAFGIWLVHGFSWIRLGLLGLAALAYVGLRDADIWSMGLLGLVVLGVGSYETIRGAALGPANLTAMVRSGWHRTRRWILVGVVLVSVSFVAGLGAFVSHRNVVNIEEALYVRIFPFPDRVAWFSAHGMPQGQAIDAQARQANAASATNAKVVGINVTAANWVPLDKWFHHQALSTYALFLLTHPDYVVSAPFASPPLTYNNASGDLSFYLPTGHDPLPFLETIFIPNRFVVSALALVALAIAAGRRAWLNRETRFLIVFVAAGLFSMLLAWHGEGMEATRHMVEGDVEVRLGVLLLLLLAVLGYKPSVVEPPHGANSLEVPEPLLTEPSREDTAELPAPALWTGAGSGQTISDRVWRQ
jgi:hypothetical protein